MFNRGHERDMKKTTPGSMIELQSHYWDHLAERYQRQTRISIDDFHYGPQIPGEATLHLLPTFQAGQTALELGCGGAQNSIWLARQGVICTAVDISAEQLRHARALAKAAKVKIRFVKTPLEHYTRRITERFTFIHSSHAMEFVDDPAKLVAQAAEQLLPAGTLMISTVHPLYNGEWVEGMDDEGQPESMGLFLNSYFSPPDDIRMQGRRVAAISRAYPVAAWFNWCRAAGLEVTRLAEPAAVAPGTTPPYTSTAWTHHEGQLDEIPGTLIIVARKRD